MYIHKQYVPGHDRTYIDHNFREWQRRMNGMQQEVLNLFISRNGHFLFESGHHGDTWLNLELLCLTPHRLQPFVYELATRLAKFEIEVICGPLVEGAFVGLMVASELGVNFSYSLQTGPETKDNLFPFRYHVPRPLRTELRNKRVAVVNDVINAGSAVRGTLADLQSCGADVAAIGTLLTLGTYFPEFARNRNLIFESLQTVPNNLWTPSACPLCAAKVPLENVAGFFTE